MFKVTHIYDEKNNLTPNNHVLQEQLKMDDNTVLFDPNTGMPVNEQAQRLIVRDWESGGDDDLYRTGSAGSHRLPYELLSECTGGFAASNILGEGGSCAVYKGSVYNFPIAVKVVKKRKQSVAGQMSAAEQKQKDYDDRQFFSEMKLLMRVNHANICRLLACSFDGLVFVCA